MRARAHWPNIAQTALNVVVVIIEVVVAEVFAVMRRYRGFFKIVDRHTHTDRQAHSSIYRVTPQLKITHTLYVLCKS